LAAFCHADLTKNRQILPDKWAKTSIVIKLQQHHNSLVALPKSRDYLVFLTPVCPAF
jgi:hypothetical protein